ncbi:maltase 1-like [Neodiprion lecontei]|uniref:alpha-glucosidase n=1 Tax=Neodiprion lecontei TaxID=441921 RepID=A0ABM3FXM5_NEOLC|nr:maltase 1-like [Neodiprion lecontei]
MASMRTAMSFLSVVLWIILAFTVETKAQNSTEREWWKDTIVYQIWTRSFQDSDSDGIGDLQGVKSRLYHFVDLGVETIWVNTIYPSPLSNSGYDVTDYKNIDSTYGDLDDFYELITAAHDLGLKVILDFIPNHSSINHTWFNASIYRTHPYTDYYIWDNGTTNASGYNIPPNNWESTLSDDGEGSAWSWNEIRQQWYLHQFTANEADFNLRNDAVIEELLDILDFWLDKGVDGFYINGVPYLLEDEDLTDNPIGSLIYTFGLADNVGLLSKFRERIDTWVLRNDNITKFVVAEGFENVENLMAYYGNDTNKGIAPVNIEFIQILTSTSNASYIKSTIDEWISALPSNQTSNWKLSNQDYSRISSRYGLNRADGLNMFILSLPGRVFTYYGEEIALLDNNEITYAETIDSLACAAGEDSYTTVTRDPYRTPMQWDTTSNAGFTESSSAYLPVHTSYLTRNVESQIASTISNIQTYKAVAALRSNPTFIYGSCEIQTLNNDKVLILRRSLDDNPTYIVVINLALSKQTINVTEIFSDVSTNLTIAVRSANAVFSDTTVTSDGFILTANAAVILTDGVDDGESSSSEGLAASVKNIVLFCAFAILSFKDWMLLLQ